jgi:four helix bundle protein
LNPGTLEPGRGSTYSFKNLTLWRRAPELAVEVAALVDTLPRKRSADALAMQLMRSATPIAANIAEGRDRFSFAAYRNHLSIAKGSAAEIQSWLDVATRLGYLDAEMAAKLDTAVASLIAALTHRIRTLESQDEKKRPTGSKVARFQGSASANVGSAP